MLLDYFPPVALAVCQRLHPLPVGLHRSGALLPEEQHPAVSAHVSVVAAQGSWKEAVGSADAWFCRKWEPPILPFPVILTLFLSKGIQCIKLFLVQWRDIYYPEADYIGFFFQMLPVNSPDLLYVLLFCNSFTTCIFFSLRRTKPVTMSSR